jgi:hypothetical protein
MMEATGNEFLVMSAMGHTNAQTAMIYQHPNLETIRTVVNGKLPVHRVTSHDCDGKEEDTGKLLKVMEPTIGLEPMTC